jgi:hypothetical protein
MSSVDTFIKRAERICDRFRKAPALTLKAREEGRTLLKQFEKYLETKGLEAPVKARRGLKAQQYGH